MSRWVILLSGRRAPELFEGEVPKSACAIGYAGGRAIELRTSAGGRRSICR